MTISLSPHLFRARSAASRFTIETHRRNIQRTIDASPLDPAWRTCSSAHAGDVRPMMHNIYYLAFRFPDRTDRRTLASCC